MEKNKKAKDSRQAANRNVSSRNKNKISNQHLQNRAKERVNVKKRRLEKVTGDLNDKLKNVEVDLKEDFVDVPEREKIIIVPDRNLEDDVLPGYERVGISRFKFVDSKKMASDKFKFVDKAEEDSPEVELEEFNSYVPSSSEKDSMIDRIIDGKEVRAVSADEFITPSTSDVDINARRHISFETRVIFLLIFIVVTFFISGLLIFKAVTSGDSLSVTYDEKSEVTYKVCVNNKDNAEYYKDTCLGEGMEYVSEIVQNIPTTFTYNVDFNQSVSNYLDYFVVSKLNIYKSKDGKILNNVEEVLLERTRYEVTGDRGFISTDILLPYNDYRDYVEKYNKEYNLDSYAEIEVSFYVDNGNLVKKVSSIKVPLSTKTFEVFKKTVDNSEQALVIGDFYYGEINTSYSVVALIFVLFGLLGIIKLANLVCKVVGSGSLYEKKLQKILKEYDRYIVIAHGEYSIDPNKKLVKTANFKELLDARNTLEKPIVYVKINNVKSDFYVEDSEVIYKYTLKEADLEKK